MSIIYLKRNKMPESVQRALDQVLYELERYGRSITSNGRVAQYLSYRFSKPRDEGLIYFVWSKRWRKSIIVLSPSVKLIRINSHKVKLVPTFSPEEILKNIAKQSQKPLLQLNKTFPYLKNH